MNTLLTAPLRRARLHVEHAQRVPDNWASELTLARTALFEAWSLSEDDQTRRIVVAQQLSVIFSLLDDTDAARSWLVTSHADATEAVRAQANVFQQSINPQVAGAKHVPIGETLQPPKGSGGWYTMVGLGLFLTWGTPLLSRKVRGGLVSMWEEQKADKAEFLKQRLEARLQEVRGPAGDEARAIIELQRDADAVREACLRLGASEVDVPNQAVRVDTSSDDIVQVSVVP